MHVFGPHWTNKLYYLFIYILRFVTLPFEAITQCYTYTCYILSHKLRLITPNYATHFLVSLLTIIYGCFPFFL